MVSSLQKGVSMKTLVQVIAGLGLSVLLLLGMVDCSSEADPVCEPGETQVCTCDGTDSGVQVCREDRTGWDNCECADGDDDTSGDDDSASGPCDGVAVLFDFETGDQGFTHDETDDGFGDPWEVGTPDDEDCHSGDSCWVTSLQGEYGDCEAGEVLSPEIDLSACAGSSSAVELRFWHLFRFEVGTEAYYDGGLVQLSSDGGASWEEVDPEPEYTGEIEGNYSECAATAEIDGFDAWSNVIDGDDWTQVTVEIDDEFRTGQFRVRYLFGSDRGLTDEGWYIDDVEIAVE